MSDIERLFLTLKYNLDNSEVEIRQHNYRSARLKHPLFAVPRDQDFEKFLSVQSGKEMDNHTVYHIIFKEDGIAFSIMCSDLRMVIGLGVEVVSRWVRQPALVFLLRQVFFLIFIFSKLLIVQFLSELHPTLINNLQSLHLKL